MNHLTPTLIRSFSEHRGTRGVHIYDSTQCEFLVWDEVMRRVHDKFPEQFYDKLVEAVANYNPDLEFVTVTAGNGQLTIELFKAEEV